MAKFLPYARLALLAGLTSLSLTSCFDRDKKCDPKPKPTVCVEPGTNPGGTSGGGSN